MKNDASKDMQAKAWHILWPVLVELGVNEKVPEGTGLEAAIEFVRGLASENAHLHSAEIEAAVLRVERDQLKEALGRAKGEVADLAGDYDRDMMAANETLVETLAERDEARARAAFLEQGLRDIEERLRTGTGPILAALKPTKDPAVVNAWKHAVYGSCIHAQIVLGHPATAGEGGGAR